MIASRSTVCVCVEKKGGLCLCFTFQITHFFLRCRKNELKKKCASGLRGALLSVIRPIGNLTINSTVSNMNFMKIDPWKFCLCLVTHHSIGYNRIALTDVKTFAHFCSCLVLSYLCRNEKYFEKKKKKSDYTPQICCV
jgi:hypothetical protein